MVGIHREIIENERENLMASSRELMEVFALVLDNILMDSHHSFSIMGNILFLTYMQNFVPHIETEKEVGPSKAKNTISR